MFLRLLRIKPDVGKKVLSENSLLKSISFDEPFLGEELVQEGKTSLVCRPFIFNTTFQIALTFFFFPLNNESCIFFLPPSAYDLPHRPNETQIFYGNMSKVILSLLGTVEASDSGQSEHTDFVRATQHHATDSDRY